MILFTTDAGLGLIRTNTVWKRCTRRASSYATKAVQLTFFYILYAFQKIGG